MNNNMVNPHREDPPELKKGSGMPITGTIPMVIPILIAKWKNRMQATP
jgi:hypothetical protein